MRMGCVATLAILASFGCDGSGNGPPGIDAGIDPLCGNNFPYQIEIFDWSSGAAALPLTIFEVGNEGNTSTSAPNGRAVLCLPSDGDVTVRLESTGHVPRNEVVSRSTYSGYLSDSGEQSYRVYLLTTADLADLGMNAGTAQVLVDLRKGSDPAVGESATLAAASDPSLVGAPGDSFSPGTQVTDGSPIIVFPNVLGAGSTMLSSNCEGPTSLPLAADEISGALLRCL